MNAPTPAPTSTYHAAVTFGGIDIIVNNAGSAHRSMPMTELPEEEYDRVFAINTKRDAAFLTGVCLDVDGGRSIS